jgi:glutamate synthase (NADPH/NADH) large chain
MQLSYNVENTQRAIGTRLSSHIVRRFGMTGLGEGHISVRLRGSAGQSLGAFATQGLRLEVIGDANDYVGKGLSGATITVRPAKAVSIVASANTIIGNTVLYGATSGKLFAAGQAGERLCVRNSGATAVVEGSGSNACEYMTGGSVVILGEVGQNFGAGMTGGMAFIYDEAGTFRSRVNPASLELGRILHPHWDDILRGFVQEHAKESESALAAQLLSHWDRAVQHFWQVVPTEIVPVLDIPLSLDEDLSETA